MTEKSFTVLDLLDLNLTGHDSLNLRCLGGRTGLSKAIGVPDINRPGLALSGFYESFAHERVQLIGRGEFAYLKKLHEENNTERIRRLFSYDIPCVIFSRSLVPPEDFLEIAEEANCSVLQTDLESTEFSTRLLRVFDNIFTPRKTLHGVLVEVYGLGILLMGAKRNSA